MWNFKCTLLFLVFCCITAATNIELTDDEIQRFKLKEEEEAQTAAVLLQHFEGTSWNKHSEWVELPKQSFDLLADDPNYIFPTLEYKSLHSLFPENMGSASYLKPFLVFTSLFFKHNRPEPKNAASRIVNNILSNLPMQMSDILEVQNEKAGKNDREPHNLLSRLLTATVDKELAEDIMLTIGSMDVCTNCGNVTNYPTKGNRHFGLRVNLKSLDSKDDQPQDLIQTIFADQNKTRKYQTLACKICDKKVDHTSTRKILKHPKKFLMVSLTREQENYFATHPGYRRVGCPTENLLVSGRVYGRLVAFLECIETDMYALWILTPDDEWRVILPDQVLIANPTDILRGYPKIGGPKILIYCSE